MYLSGKGLTVKFLSIRASRLELFRDAILESYFESCEALFQSCYFRE